MVQIGPGELIITSIIITAALSYLLSFPTATLKKQPALRIIILPSMSEKDTNDSKPLSRSMQISIDL